MLEAISLGGTPSRSTGDAGYTLGLPAVDVAHDRAWGQMIALRGTDIVRVSLTAATTEFTTVRPQPCAEAEVFLG